MNVQLKKRLLFALLILLLAGYRPVCAQQKGSQDKFDITLHCIRFPHNNETREFQKSLGISMVKPPLDLVEMAVQAPLLHFHMNYWLPGKLSLEGDFTTLFVSSQLCLGPRINFSHNRIGMNIGCDLAIFAGFLKRFGFNNTTHGWIYYPNISIGYKLKDIAFTLKTEAIVVGSVSTRTGDDHLASSNGFFNGFSGALYIEQRIHKRRVFVTGIKNNYVKYYWPIWMTFSTFNRFYNIPELYFSWIL